MNTMYSAMRSRLDVDENIDYFEKLANMCRRDSDIISRLELYFWNEVGTKFCAIGTFKNIVDRALSYHRQSFPPRIIEKMAEYFPGSSPGDLDWRGFVERCKYELEIANDLDEVLGKSFCIIVPIP